MHIHTVKTTLFSFRWNRILQESNEALTCSAAEHALLQDSNAKSAMNRTDRYCLFIQSTYQLVVLDTVDWPAYPLRGTAVAGRTVVHQVTNLADQSVSNMPGNVYSALEI